MRKTFFILLVAMIIIAACQPKSNTIPVDTAAAKDSVSALLDRFSAAMKSKNVNVSAALITEDGLLCGTDPSEFWDKKKWTDELAKMAADTSVRIDYSIDKREIKMAPEGNSAIVIEQGIMPSLSPRISFRMIYHVEKTGDIWLIDFISWSFIPKNEDIPRLNMAME